MARVPPPQGGFADDPHAPLVYALEEFDEETSTATKAEIFTQRVTAPRQVPDRAGTAEEAAAISLDMYGEVRLDVVARLLELADEQAARTALGTVVFTEPHTERLVPAAEYLSGNVRIKLTQARDAADIDETFAVNVQALAEVQPKDVPPEEIRVKLGAPWVAALYVQEFLRELLRDESIKVERAAGSTWTVNCSTERNVIRITSASVREGRREAAHKEACEASDGPQPLREPERAALLEAMSSPGGARGAAAQQLLRDGVPLGLARQRSSVECGHRQAAVPRHDKSEGAPPLQGRDQVVGHKVVRENVVHPQAVLPERYVRVEKQPPDHVHAQQHGSQRDQACHPGTGHGRVLLESPEAEWSLGERLAWVEPQVAPLVQWVDKGWIEVCYVPDPKEGYAVILGGSRRCCAGGAAVAFRNPARLAGVSMTPKNSGRVSRHSNPSARAAIRRRTCRLASASGSTCRGGVQRSMRARTEGRVPRPRA